MAKTALEIRKVERRNGTQHWGEKALPGKNGWENYCNEKQGKDAEIT